MGKLGNHRGMSLPEILMSFTLVSFLIIGSLQALRFLSRQQFRSNLTAQSDLVRRNLVTFIQNDQAWLKTINDSANTPLACLKNNTSCTGTGGPIRLRDTQNNIVYDGLTSPTAGLGPDGQPCNSFNATTGNDACPLRIELTVTPLCTGTCVAPQMEIVGTPIYKPKAKEREVAFNGKNYGFKLVRNALAIGGLSPVTLMHTSVHNFGFVNQVGGLYPFDIAYSNPGGNFDSATNYFVAPEAGVYAVSVSTCLTTNAQAPNAWCRIELRATGADTIGTSLSAMISNQCTNATSGITSLSPGDRVWVTMTLVNPDFGAGSPHQSTCPQTEWSVFSAVKIR